MKKNILKQSVIALVVGAAVSGVSVAADTDPLATATSALKEAIKSELQAKADATKAEQDAKINNISTSLSKATGRLNGVAANSYNNTLTLSGFKVDDSLYEVDDTGVLTKKKATAEDVEADPLKGKGVIKSITDTISDVDELEKEIVDTVNTVNDHTKVLDGDDTNPGLVTKVNNLEDDVYGDDKNPGLVEVVDKHTEAIYGTDKDPDSGLINVVNKQTEAIAKLEARDTYNHLDKVEELIKDKADKTDVDANKAEIAKKANLADVTTEFSNTSNKLQKVNADVEKNTQSIRENKASIKAKAGKDYVDQKLAEKADSADVTAKLNQKVDQSTLYAYNNSLVTAIGKKADQTDVDANKAAIGDLATVIDEAVKNVEEGITANKADIETNADKIADNASKIAENRKDINKNALRIQDTRNKQFLQNTRLDNHGERIEANKAAIGDLATATDKAVKNLGDAVRDLDEDLAGTQDAVAENRKDIDKNASRITDTRNKQVLQNARLDNHGERIDANKAAIADNASKIATNELKVSENRKDIDKNASRITDTRNKQVLQNARLDNHGQRIDANKAAIATNVANIATNTAAVATNTAAVATNTAAVATNRANIATNTAAIAAHNQRLDHLDNRVNKLDKDLKRGLASQAALTGLFQPYTVGKVNFTAAVGGYKSQTAVAIGTGYRYNQNIATKAGVAFTQGGGVTYNAGVNFEW